MKRTIFAGILLMGCLAACTTQMQKDEFEPTTLSKIKIVEKTASSITLECNFVADDEYGITEKGIEWGISDMFNNYIHLIEKDEIGTIRLTYNYLTEATTYYFRLFEKSEFGIRYSNMDSITTDIDGRPYLMLYWDDIKWYPNETHSAYIAQVSMQVSNVGHAPLIRRGLCWQKVENPLQENPPPTIETDETLFVAIDGDGKGYYYADIQPLEPEQYYCVRAFAENDFGIKYSDPVGFYTYTNYDKPTVITLDPIMNIDGSVIFGGTLYDIGEDDVIKIGICYSTEYDRPTFNPPDTFSPDTSVELELISPITSKDVPYTFKTGPITGLTGGVTYYIRAFALNKRYDQGLGNTKTYTPPISAKE